MPEQARRTPAHTAACERVVRAASELVTDLPETGFKMREPWYTAERCLHELAHLALLGVEPQAPMSQCDMALPLKLLLIQKLRH